MRSVFAMTVAANVGYSKLRCRPDDQRSSSPPPPAPKRSRHWRSRLGPDAWNAIAWWGHADALNINQQHALAKQRRPRSLPPVSNPIRRRVQGRPAQPHRDTFRPAGLHRGGRRRELHREVGPTTESCRNRHRRLHETVGPSDARQ